MAYIGQSPAPQALVASDITDGIISNAKLAQDIISADTALGAEPSDSDEFLVSDSGVLKRMDYSYIKASGITEVDQWRLTAATTGDNDPIASNLERVDTPSDPKIGTGMSESSGIFTFPSTGIWLVSATFLWYASSSSDGNCYGYIAVTTDNSSYVDRAEIVRFFSGSDDGSSVHGSLLLDVTSTTNVKVRFETNLADNGDQAQGNTARNLTHFTFIRLGDT